MDLSVVLVVVGGILAYAGLVALAWSMRRNTHQQSAGDEPDRYLRRTDLIEGEATPSNPLEWLITVATRSAVQLGLLGMTLGLTVILAITGYRGAAAVGAFVTLLVFLMLMLFFGWESLESFFATPERPEDKSEEGIHAGSLPASTRTSLQVQGGTPVHTSDGLFDAASVTDLKVGVTLGVIVVVVMSLFVLGIELII